MAISSVAYEKALHFKWRGCNGRRLFRLYSTLLQDSFVTLTFTSVDENLWCYYSSQTSLVELFHASIYFLGFYPPPPPPKKNCIFVIFFIIPWALLGGVQSCSRYDWDPQSKLSTAPIHAPLPSSRSHFLLFPAFLRLIVAGNTCTCRYLNIARNCKDQLCGVQVSVLGSCPS